MLSDTNTGNKSPCKGRVRCRLLSGALATRLADLHDGKRFWNRETSTVPDLCHRWHPENDFHGSRNVAGDLSLHTLFFAVTLVYYHYCITFRTLRYG